MGVGPAVRREAPRDEFAGLRWTRQARNAYPEMRPALKIKAETNAEVMGVALDSPRPIKSEQCVDIMILSDCGRRKIVHA